LTAPRPVPTGPPPSCGIRAVPPGKARGWVSLVGDHGSVDPGGCRGRCAVAHSARFSTPTRQQKRQEDKSHARPRENPQHRHLRPHRLGQDDPDRAHPLLHGSHPRDPRGQGQGRRRRQDGLDGARARAGITIQSAATYCLVERLAVEAVHDNINIIDTPGHVDFTIEVERALRVLDGAILVLCSGKGVQSQSITVDRQMKRYRVPRIAFINKMDRPGANYERVAEHAAREAHHHPVQIQVPIGAEDKFEGIIDPSPRRPTTSTATTARHPRRGPARRARRQGQGGPRQAHRGRSPRSTTSSPRSSSKAKRSPSTTSRPPSAAPPLPEDDAGHVRFGLKNKGVQLLLDAVCDYLPNRPRSRTSRLRPGRREHKIELDLQPVKPLVGLAFKLEEDKYGQLTYYRVYQGTVEGRHIVNTSQPGKKVKVGRASCACTPTRWRTSSRPGRRHRRLFGVDCSSGDTFTDGSSTSR
jgi:elongation factor G